MAQSHWDFLILVCLAAGQAASKILVYIRLLAHSQLNVAPTPGRSAQRTLQRSLREVDGALTSRDSGNQPAACVKPPQVSDEPRLSRRGRRMSYTGCGCGCSKGSVAPHDPTTATTSLTSEERGPVTLGLPHTRLPRCWPSSVEDSGIYPTRGTS